MRIARPVFAALMLAAVSFSPLATPANALSNVTISPTNGGQHDTFTIEGVGIQTGLALDINFVSPTGDVFSTAALNKVVVVDEDGEFAFEVTPSSEFSGQPAGTWTVQVCVSGTDDCIQTTFNIAL
ncbi:MAG: hypothetical protein IT305_02365 [Chloroflexi bacterium]|nr:hypothetical protein [Chloroflexota bacterium]